MLKAHEGFTGDAVTSDANLARVTRRRKQASYEAAETSELRGGGNKRVTWRRKQASYEAAETSVKLVVQAPA